MHEVLEVLLRGKRHFEELDHASAAISDALHSEHMHLPCFVGRFEELARRILHVVVALDSEQMHLACFFTDAWSNSSVH